MKWTLEEFAEKVNISPEQIREYVTAGLLPTKVAGDSELLFDDSDSYWLDMIQCFVGNGTSVDELKHVIKHCHLN